MLSSILFFFLLYASLVSGLVVSISLVIQVSLDMKRESLSRLFPPLTKIIQVLAYYSVEPTASTIEGTGLRLDRLA